MLPVIVTSTLAKGAVVLSKMKVIVKHLDAIQNFGAMDVLCTDKTGTLTQDKICLSRHTDIWGKTSDDVLKMAYLNSYHQTGLKNLLDVAVLDHTDAIIANTLQADFDKVDEVPFDFERRRMSVVVSDKNGKPMLICKGAVEEMLSVCQSARHGENDEALTPTLLADLRKITEDLNKDGLRVVAVAAKTFEFNKNTYGVADESELVLIGYVAFLDPPKESTEPALKALAANGISVKVLTGDNELVTAKICAEVGFQGNKKAILGPIIEFMSNEELSKIVEEYSIFAKLTPMHKERIVRILKANGHVVGFMGDGINDAPALRAADIGISVDTAVDIAKEAADIILLEKSLMVLENGVLEGRRTFANMIKYIKMAASSNFGNVFSVLIASVFLPFLPMLPLQILVQNLLYDISQIAIPFDAVDEDLIKKPQRWNPSEIGRFMVYFGPTSSVFDVITFAVMWFIFHANSVAHQTLFQSAWFVEGLLTQTLVVHMIRTKKIPFLQSRPSGYLLFSTLIIMAIGVIIPMTPIFSGYFSMQSLPLSYFPVLIIILFAYMWLTQIVKSYYIKRFGWQ
jgi:Mg2+-importing ATPase